MHKRLLIVALGLSLGLITTRASSRTYDFDHNSWHADDSDRSSSSAPRRHRVAYAYRSDAEEAEPLNHRSVTRDHPAARHGHGGTSRGCLTAATRALLDRVEAQFGKNADHLHLSSGGGDCGHGTALQACQWPGHRL
mgnify:CR=1 FL=1